MVVMGGRWGIAGGASIAPALCLPTAVGVVVEAVVARGVGVVAVDVVVEKVGVVVLATPALHTVAGMCSGWRFSEEIAMVAAAAAAAENVAGSVLAVLGAMGSTRALALRLRHRVRL